MESSSLNPTQLHLLRMFSYAKDESSLNELKEAMSAYFARRVEEEMDELWDKGLWDQEKNDNLLREHLRTSYHE